MDQQAFLKIYQLMQKAFPQNEIRDLIRQQKLLQDKRYQIKPYWEEGRLLGFVAFWDMDDFIYIEHIAVDETLRGKGLGSAMLKELQQSENRPIILEVEPGQTQLQKRRINFYQRLGFQLNDQYYLQMPLNEGDAPARLLIMSYPDCLKDPSFFDYRKKLYRYVYRCIQ